MKTQWTSSSMLLATAVISTAAGLWVIFDPMVVYRLALFALVAVFGVLGIMSVIAAATTRSGSRASKLLTGLAFFGGAALFATHRSLLALSLSRAIGLVVMILGIVAVMSCVKLFRDGAKGGFSQGIRAVISFAMGGALFGDAIKSGRLAMTLLGIYLLCYGLMFFGDYRREVRLARDPNALVRAGWRLPLPAALAAFLPAKLLTKINEAFARDPELLIRAGAGRVTSGAEMSRPYCGCPHDGEPLLMRYVRVVSLG